MEWRIVGSRMVVGVSVMIDEKWFEKVARRLTRTLMRLVSAFGNGFFFVLPSPWLRKSAKS